jgi:hypothetical protein
MNVDRRAGFFLVAALLCGLLAPLTGGYAWVALVMSGIYVVLAAGSWLDHHARHGGAP